MEKMKDLCSIKATLVDSVKEQLSHGIECVDAHEMGEVVDMIKDIYEAENYCMQSKYYKSIVEAMGDGSYGYNPTEFADQMKLRYGYMDQNEPKMMNKPVSTYGAAYDSWSDARKHYTKTGSSEDKERMEERGKEHVEKAIISMRDIWSEASPELKRAMKTELSTLVDNMTI
jgi:hypothetical protein